MNTYLTMPILHNVKAIFIHNINYTFTQPKKQVKKMPMVLNAIIFGILHKNIAIMAVKTALYIIRFG